MSDPPTDPRASLGQYLEVSFDDWEQDWEYSISGEVKFDKCLELYQASFITDAQRECLVEIMIDKAANEFSWSESIEEHPYWHAIEKLIQGNMTLHAATLDYWQSFASSHAYGAVGKRIRQIRAGTKDGV